MAAVTAVDPTDLEALACAALEVASIELAHRRPDAAAGWLDRACGCLPERWRTRWLVLRCEAAAGRHEQDVALGCLAELEQTAAVSGDPWTCGAVARARGLTVCDPETAHRWFMLAADHHRMACAAVDAGRDLVLAAEAAGHTHPSSRRASLLDAAALFRDAGSPAWEHRARSGLSPIPALLDQLTAAERRVVDEVAVGGRNTEVAAHLHLSVRTVESHLERIYRKLGVRSRVELSRLVS